MKHSIVVVLVLIGLRAAAEPGLVWAPQPVRAPVAPDSVREVAPYVPEATAEVTGEITIGPDQAAALWLDPLDVVRVRADTAARPRFVRVLGPGAGGINAGARGLLEESGVPAAPGIWYLTQPPGRGDVWRIDAPERARILVERPVVRRGRLIWDELQEEVLEWIEQGGPKTEPPAIPFVAGSAEVRTLLRAEHELGQALVQVEPGLAPAVRAWRKASALGLLLPLRPLHPAFFDIEALEERLPGAGGAVTLSTGSTGLDATLNDRPFHRFEAGATNGTLELSGPGVLRVEVRAALGRQPSTRPPVVVAIVRGGELLGRGQSDGQPARAPSAADPPPAFPPVVPLRADGDEWVGERILLSVPLAPGRHAYAIQASGGPLLVRVAAARYRPRLGRNTDATDYIETARHGLGTTPAAQWLAARLARLDGQSIEPAPIATELPALLAPGLRTTQNDSLALFAALPAQASEAVKGYWLLELARGLAGHGDAAALRRLLQGLTELPSAEILGPLTELFPDPTMAERLRSPSVGALDLAWRQRPVEPGIVRRYRDAWRSGVWSLLPPEAPRPEATRHGEALAAPRAYTWLERPSAGPAVDPGEVLPGQLTQLPIGAPRRLRAAPSSAAAGRAALVRIYVVTPADAPGPIGLHVDGQGFAMLALEPVERLELALPLGDHDFRLDAPTGTLAWASLPPAAENTIPPEETANLRHYWPITSGGAPLRYPLPDPRVPGPIRVALRAIGGNAAGEPIQVQIHTDMGERRTLTFIPGAVDPATYAVDAPGPVSGEVTVVFRAPPGARELWLTTASPIPLVAAVAVRRADTADADSPTESVARPNARAVLDRIAALSRRLATEPQATDALLERANLLLDLEQGDLARQDMVRVAGDIIDHTLAAQQDRLLGRLDAWTEPSYIALPMARPAVALAPPLLALASGPDVLEPLVPVARVLRTKGAEDALAALRPADDSLTGAVRAQLTNAPLDRAREYLQTGNLASGLAAADSLARALSMKDRNTKAAPRGAAALLFGLATRLGAEVGHPVLRRAMVLGAALSRWETLEGTDSNAGQERLYLNESPPASAGGAVREALLAAPWNPRRAHTLTPGGGAALDVTLNVASTVGAELWCQELKIGATPTTCNITVRIDGVELRTGTVAIGRLVRPAPRALAPGRHRLEVVLGAEDPNVIASVRFTTDRPLTGSSAEGRTESGYSIPIEKPWRTYVAEANQPVVVTVLGPATLHVELRGTGKRPTAAVVRAVPTRGAPLSERVELTSALDPNAHGEPGRTVEPGLPADVLLLLTEASPYRVVIAPETGQVLTHLRLRVDAANAVPPPVPPPWWQGTATSTLLPWPALFPPLASVDGEIWTTPEPSTLGTFSFELSAGSAQIGEQDTALQEFAGVLQFTVGWRRQLIDDSLWLRLSPFVRYRQKTDNPIWGTSAEIYLKHLPLELRLDGYGSMAAQPFLGGVEFAISGGLRLDRSIDLGSNLSLVPSLALRTTYQSLDRATVVVAGKSVDVDVYNDYTRTHAVGLVPRLSLWWGPFQDQLFQLATFAITTRQLATIDYAGVTLDWHALFPFLGETEVELVYRPTYRFQNADREQAFFRHDLSASLHWSVWTGRTGRVVLGVDAALFAAFDRIDTTFAFTLRYDLTSGRALHDILPPEQSFETLMEKLPWEPTPPGTL